MHMAKMMGAELHHIEGQIAVDDDGEPEQSGFLELDIDVRETLWQDSVPTLGSLQALAADILSVAGMGDTPCDVCLSFVGDTEIHHLNLEYRNRDKPTNVLSFPGCAPDELEDMAAWAQAGGPPVMLGDVVVTYGVTAAEAVQQGKDFADHLLHLIIHGLLHLLGYDHIEDQDAEIMEALEVKILAKQGIANPYEHRA